MIEKINPKLSGMISLAQKAGKLAVGESRAQEAIRGNKAHLIILARDASENTLKKFSDMSAYRDIPIVFLPDRYEFGMLIGKKFSVSAAVTDKGFAENIIRLYETKTQAQ